MEGPCPACRAYRTWGDPIRRNGCYENLECDGYSLSWCYLVYLERRPILWIAKVSASPSSTYLQDCRLRTCREATPSLTVSRC